MKGFLKLIALLIVLGVLGSNFPRKSDSVPVRAGASEQDPKEQRAPAAKVEVARERVAAEKKKSDLAEDAAKEIAFEDCRQRLAGANRAGIIHDIKFAAGGLGVVVDSSTWRTMSYDTKVGMAETLSCWSLAGDRTKRRTIIFYDHRTNHVVGRYGLYGLEVK